MKFGQFVSYLKEKILSKSSIKLRPANSFQTPFVLSKNLAKPLLENQILEQANYVRYVIAKLSKFIQVSMQVSSDSFLQWIL